MSEESVLNDLRDLKSKDSELKWSAVNNLRKYLQSNPADFRYRLIVKSILSLVHDPNSKIREIVLSTLLEIIPDSKKLEPILLTALKDSNPGIRSLALEWIGKQNYYDLKTYTLNGLHDESEVVRKTALEIVLAQQFQGVETDLLRLLDSEKGGLRRTVIYTLGKLKTAQAIKALIEIMRNSEYDDWTRNQAGSALEHMGGKELISPFIENLADPNDYVRESAAAFLIKNESNLVSVISSSGRLDYIALLQHGTETTKQNFDSSVTALTSQLSFAIEDLRTRLLRQDEINIVELASELRATSVSIKILLEKILKLWILPLSEERYLTETGLNNRLIKELTENKSVNLRNLQTKSPFRDVTFEFLDKKFASIHEAYLIEPGVYLEKDLFNKYRLELETNGIINVQNIAQDINQSIDLVISKVVPAMDVSRNGWYNSRNEYLTPKYLNSLINHQIEQFKIISIKRLLNDIGKPDIDITILKQMIHEKFQGKWLEDIGVFIEFREFQKIAENAIRIDEERVTHLLEPIGYDFPSFLRSLQGILDIKTFKTKSGQLISLESLHPLLEQRVLEKGFVNITNVMAELSLDSSVKSIILEYLNQNFHGKFDIHETYYFTEELINKTRKKVEEHTRFNYDVLSFELELSAEILPVIVEKVLLIKGISNSIGEFITLKGIDQEIQGILNHKGEFVLQELFEILELKRERENEEVIINQILKKNLWISNDNKWVFTHKRAFGKVLAYLKGPTIRTNNRISWGEISFQTNIPEKYLKPVLESLIQNNLLAGSLEKKGFRP